MKKESAVLNERYFHFMKTGRPFVHLKLAVSLDGKIATRTGHSRWIAGEASRLRAQEFRHECDAILVGAGTVLLDDPMLTDRSNLPRRRPLTRVVLDERLEIPLSSRLVQSAKEAPVIVYGGAGTSVEITESLKEKNVEVVRGSREILRVLEDLGNRSIQSVLVEGGGKVAGAFLDAGLVNKVTFFIAPVIIGGAEAHSAVAGVGVEKMEDALRLRDVTVTQRGPDIEVTGYAGEE
jgi:diaminohydroxyphosphoribosylaminopyrimidine deaminase/5-amino-6-(5-phosphoribosylamino)uracil reductase